MKCPHLRRPRAGDESMDFCKLDDRICLLVGYPSECPYWDEIKAEWEKEKTDTKQSSAYTSELYLRMLKNLGG